MLLWQDLVCGGAHECKRGNGLQSEKGCELASLISAEVNRRVATYGYRYDASIRAGRVKEAGEWRGCGGRD